MYAEQRMHFSRGVVARRAALAISLCASSVVHAQIRTDSSARHSGVAGVVSDSLGHPIRAVRVLVEGSQRSAVTDDSGRFDLRGLPAGKNAFMITKIGYAPISFEAALLPDSVVVLSVRMHTVQILNTVNVNAIRTNKYLDRIGFTERKQKAWGYFMTPERLDTLSQRVMSPAELFREVPGLVVNCGLSPSQRRAHASAHCIVNTTIGCQPTLVVDGASYSGEQIDELGLTPSIVAAVEVYRSGATVPVDIQEKGGGGCGTIVVWTKLRVP